MQYVDRLAAVQRCLFRRQNVQAWLGEAPAGRCCAVWEILVRDNPLPAVHGRVCYHPCEDACNRHAFDEAVSIHAVERVIGDAAVRGGWTVLELGAGSPGS